MIPTSKAIGYSDSGILLPEPIRVQLIRSLLKFVRKPLFFLQRKHLDLMILRYIQTRIKAISPYNSNPNQIKKSILPYTICAAERFLTNHITIQECSHKTCNWIKRKLGSI